MSTDLAIPAVMWLALGALAAVGAARGTQRWPENRARGMCLLALLAFVGFLFLARGREFWARLLPLTNIVLWHDLTPLLASAFSGLAWRQLSGPRWRRALVLTPLTAISAACFLSVLVVDLPPCSDHWSDDVCLQSSEVTCSAACAATLLRHAGVPAAERELALLSLTSRPIAGRAGGTNFLGLYRGLRIKTYGLPWRVETYGGALDGLLVPDSGPWIISVGLTSRTTDPIYEEQYGWPRGLRHSVVLYRQVSADRVEIGDPSVGREQWSLEDLRVLWLDNAVRRVARPPPTQSAAAA